MNQEINHHGIEEIPLSKRMRTASVSVTSQLTWPAWAWGSWWGFQTFPDRLSKAGSSFVLGKGMNDDHIVVEEWILIITYCLAFLNRMEIWFWIRIIWIPTWSPAMWRNVALIYPNGREIWLWTISSLMGRDGWQWWVTIKWDHGSRWDGKSRKTVGIHGRIY